MSTNHSETALSTQEEGYNFKEKIVTVDNDKKEIVYCLYSAERAGKCYSLLGEPLGS